MAEVLGLLASIAGVSTAGINVATHLYSITRLFKGLEDEIKSVAREIETLSSVFEEISTTLQLGNEGSSTPITKLNVSRSAIVTLSDLVQDSQSLYEKIAQTVSDQSNLKGQVKWLFRREDVETWSARLSKNVSLVTLMMTTLLWAEKRRTQFAQDPSSEGLLVAKSNNGVSADKTIRPENDATDSKAPTHLPGLIQKQVGETVLCMENLRKLEEAYDEGAVKVRFPTGEDLEPRHYVYQPHYGSAMRRENPERESLWLSEHVNIGDENTLAERLSVMTSIRNNMSENDFNIDDEQNQADQATELADRLVQDWTNLTKVEDTGGWIVTSAEATTNTTEQSSLPVDDRSEAAVLNPNIKPLDLRALYFSQRALEFPEITTRTAKTMSRAEKFEDEKLQLIKSCFSRQDTDGSQVESYITHILIIEDRMYPSSPPPSTAGIKFKKARYIVISVRKSGRVRIHKARENFNGTFSIGKTWVLDDLTAVKVYHNSNLWDQSESSQIHLSREGFSLTIGKPYYWQALSPRERESFTNSLVKIYHKYTRGKMPELIGFTEEEIASIWVRYPTL